MNDFDWHSDTITRKTVIGLSYRNTQNARRFFKAQCGDHFKYDRSFMKWLKDNPDKSMGNAVEEWLSRQS